MNTPTHHDISRRAHRLWQTHGCPAGRDTAIWLEAEQQLKAEHSSANPFVTGARLDAPVRRVGENQLSPVQKEQNSIQAAVRKQDARAPKSPRHTGPKPKPAVTGKPLWPQP